MKIICVDLSSSEKIALAVQEAVDFLRQGKVIVYPTDTIYGLGCDAMSAEAIAKIYEIKKRDKGKPLSVIVKDIDAMKNIAFVDRRIKTVAQKLLPGPYTFILPGPQKVPRILLGKEKTIGVRIPDNQICQEISAAFANPVVTTSVNLSGENSLSDPFKIVEYFKNKEKTPDLVLDCGKIEDAQPSIVIDLTKRSPQIVRSGARSLNEVMTVLNKLKDL